MSSSGVSGGAFDASVHSFPDGRAAADPPVRPEDDGGVPEGDVACRRVTVACRRVTVACLRVTGARRRRTGRARHDKGFRAVTAASAMTRMARPALTIVANAAMAANGSVASPSVPRRAAEGPMDSNGRLRLPGHS